MDDQTYQLFVPVKKAALVATWLRDLSDGYTSFKLDGEKDFSEKRLPGPFAVSQTKKARVKRAYPGLGNPVSEDKPYFIGISSEVQKEALPPFEWNDAEGELKRTALYEVHKSSGGRMVPFAGWEMPVQYTGIYRGASCDAQCGGTVRRLAHGRV